MVLPPGVITKGCNTKDWKETSNNIHITTQPQTNNGFHNTKKHPGLGGGQNTVICLNIVPSSLDFHCLCTFTRVKYQKGLHRIHYLYLYPSQRRTLHCTFGDGFSIESTKACKKIKNKKTNSYQRRTNDLLTRSSKTNYERTTGELTI